MEIKNTFVGGRMSQDVNERLVSPDLYSYGENIRILNSVSGDAGVVSNVLGNTKLTNFNLTNGKTIGAFADNSNSKLYFFVTSDTKDMVVEYNDKIKSAVVVLESSNGVLDFDKSFPITGVVKIINGDPDRDMLVWTDDRTEPKIINIEQAKAYGLNGFTEEDITLIKAAPAYPPMVEMIERGLVYNNLEDKFFSFSQRFRYKNGFYSALAPFTPYQFVPVTTGTVELSTKENTGMVNKYDTVKVTYDIGDDNVESIEVVFKESKSNVINVIGTYNRNDLLYNPTGNFINFSNDSAYTILPEDELLRVFDNVPRKAKALEQIGSRLCFGNYVEGYDMKDNDGNDITMGIFTSVVSTTPADDSKQSVKTNRSYDVGVVYFDKYGRRSTVQKSLLSNIYVTPDVTTYQNKLRVQIYNNAPYWADRFQLVFKESTDGYENLFLTKVYADGTYRWLLLDGINKNKVQENDTLIVKKDDVGAVLSLKEVKVLELKEQAAGFLSGAPAGLYIKILPSGFTCNTIDVLKVFETKSANTSANVFYEAGDVYTIVNGYHNGNVQNQSDIYNQCIIDSKFYNCFVQGDGIESYKYKDGFVANSVAVDLIPNSVSVEPYREVRRYADLTYSEIYNENTNLNGLNEFNLAKANFKEDIDKKYGSIQKLFSRDSDLMVFQEDKISKVLYGKNLLMNADGSSNVSAMDEVLGQQVMYTGEYGISKEPESFAVFGNRVYNTDTKRGVVLRTSIDGITEIVTGLKNIFRDSFIDTEGTNKYGAYDPYNDQYVLALDSEKIIENTVLEIGGSYEVSNYSGTLPLTIDLGNYQGTFFFVTSNNGKPVRYVTTFNGVTTDSGYIGDSQYNDELDALGLPNVVGSSYSYTSASKTNENACNASITVYAPLCGTSFKISDIRFNSLTILLTPIVLGDIGDAPSEAYVTIEWLHGVYTGSTKMIPVTFNGEYPVVQFGDIGDIGKQHYPAPNSIITLKAVEKTTSPIFTASNKIGYYFTNTLLPKWDYSLSLATYPTVNTMTSGDETINYITFPYGATKYNYLYIIWDYRDSYENFLLQVSTQKNSCIAPATGTWVTYTVPAGTYTSLISQEDADDQAAADAAANAQTYANTNGDCVGLDGNGSTLVISSSIPDGNGLGTLDFVGGENLENISLNFLYEYTIVGYIDLEGDITVAPIDSLHSNINGTVHLDANGEAHIYYEITDGSKCTVTITNRSSAEPDPVILTTVIDNS